MMHGDEKSDPVVVAENRANADGRPSAEGGEPRTGAKGNTSQTDTRRTPSRASVPLGLERVRTAARLNKEGRFTALLDHVDTALLRQAYLWLKREAAPGVHGVTWAEYGQGLEEKLRDLHERVHRGSYRALVHPETGWTAAAVGHRGAGGQDRPAGGGRGAERDLRGRLPRVLVRVPAGAQPARRAGRAGGRDHAHAGELDTGRRPPELLRHGKP